MPVELLHTDHFEMEYCFFGEGERAFVILPGLAVQSVMNSADAIAAQYAALTKDYTVYVFDRRKDVPSSYSVYDMAEDTAEAMKALGLTDTDLFGASQGGMMALWIAITHPELVRRLILGSSAVYVDEGRIKGLEEWVALAKAKDGVGLYRSFGKKVYPKAVYDQYVGVLEELGKTVTEEEFERFVIFAEGTKGFDVREDIDKISCPVLILGSKDDHVLGEEAVYEAIEAFKGKEMISYVYKDYGHAAYDLAPDYLQRIVRFCKGVY